MSFSQHLSLNTRKQYSGVFLPPYVYMGCKKSFCLEASFLTRQKLKCFLKKDSLRTQSTTAVWPYDQPPCPAERLCLHKVGDVGLGRRQDCPSYSAARLLLALCVAALRGRGEDKGVELISTLSSSIGDSFFVPLNHPYKAPWFCCYRKSEVTPQMAKGPGSLLLYVLQVIILYPERFMKNCPRAGLQHLALISFRYNSLCKMQCRGETFPEELFKYKTGPRENWLKI